MPYVMNDSVRIHYRVEGEGPPLVLQHGFFWSMRGWYRIGYVDALKSRFRLVLIDARGHGDSSKPYDGSAYSLERHVSDITAVLDAVGFASAAFWGFSMGGWVAYGMAKYAAARVDSLIIGAAHPYARRLPPESRPSGNDPVAFVDAFFERLGLRRERLSAAELAEFVDNDFHALSASLQDRPALEDILPGMNMPCLLYVGEKDGICAQVATCARQIPSARLRVLPQLNHPEAFYRADLVLPHVEEFLGSTTSTR